MTRATDTTLLDAAQLRALVEALPVPVALLDEDLRLRGVSQAWERLTGATAVAQLGHSLCAALPDLGAPLEPLLRAVLAGGEPVRGAPLEGTAAGPPGSASLAASVSVLGRAGTAARTLVVTVEEIPSTGDRPGDDPSAGRRGRHVERAPEPFLDAIIENIPDMIFVKDARDLRYVRFNRAAEELLGIPRTELIGRSDRDFFPADEAEFFIRRDREVLEGNVFVDIPEETVHTRTKGVRVLHTKKVPICDAEGVPAYLLGISEDITELKRAEAFRLSDLLVRHIADYAVFLLDGEGRVKTWNAGAERVTGFSSEEIVGRPFGGLLADAAGADSLLSEAAARGHVDREEEWRHKNGHPIWTLTELTAIRAGEGPPVLFGAITRDVSERKKAERERDELLERLKEAVRARDEFLSVASHELRTPVATLTLQGELLEKAALQAVPDSSAPIHAKIARISRQTSRLVRMIDTLLDVSRLMSGRIELQCEWVELGQVVEAVVGRFHEERPEVPLRLEATAGLTGYWDPLRLDQAVTNIIDNALKYGSGAPVEVWVEGDDRVARVGVRDCGIGITRDQLKRIFDPFTRAVPERQFGGLGMGLFIVKQLAEAHGGQVRVDSHPGRGTTVILEVPRNGPPHRPGGR